MKKALLIAISYRGTASELRGCVSDQERLYDYIRKSNPDCDIRVLCDDKRINAPVYSTPTRYNILKQIEWLVAGATADSHLWISYSGHGGSERSRDASFGRRRKVCSKAKRLLDKEAHEDRVWPSSNQFGRRRRRRRPAKRMSADEEIDRMDETIVPVDYRRRGQITDDVLRKQLVDTLPRGAKLTAFFDCCHSGTVLDLRYNWLDKEPRSKLPAIDKQEHQNCTESQARVLMLSGCLDNQTAADAYINNTFCGATTTAFLHFMQVIAHDAAKAEQNTRAFGDGNTTDGHIDTLEELLHAMNKWMVENHFAQRPQLSLGRPENTRDAVQTFFPLLKQ